MKFPLEQAMTAGLEESSGRAEMLIYTLNGSIVHAAAIVEDAQIRLRLGLGLRLEKTSIIIRIHSAFASNTLSERYVRSVESIFADTAAVL